MATFTTNASNMDELLVALGAYFADRGNEALSDSMKTYRTPNERRYLEGRARAFADASAFVRNLKTFAETVEEHLDTLPEYPERQDPLDKLEASLSGQD